LINTPVSALMRDGRKKVEMMKAAVGLSTDPDTTRAGLDAAREVVDGLGGEQADFCVVFVTDEHADHLDGLLGAVSGVTGTPYVSGCSASGLLAGDRELEGGPAVGVLGVRADRLRATPFLFRDEGDLGLTAGQRLGRRLDRSAGTDDIVLVWPDPLHVRPDRLLQGIASVLGKIRVVGGAASGAGAEGSTFQFSGSESAAAAVSGLRLRGRFRCAVGVTQGCHPLGPAVRVTRAHGNMILEIDGRSPLEVLRELAPEPLVSDLASAVDFLFVGLVPESGTGGPPPRKCTIRNIVDADPDTGVLVISDRLAEGSSIVFAIREASEARSDMQRMLDELRGGDGAHGYRFGLYFNCRARGSRLYGEPGVDIAMLRRAFPDLPLLGFFSNAEIAPVRGENRLLTYTGVLLLVGEADGASA